MTTIFQYQDANGDWRTGVGVPGQLSTSNVTSSSADLTLPSAVTGAQYYELSESTDNGSTWTVVDSAIAPGAIVSPATYSRSGLTSGATYQWRLRAKFASLVSPLYSAVRSAQISSFIPAKLVNFDGLTNGQAVFGSGSVAGKRFDAVLGNTPFAGGYGSQATTTLAMPGSTSCCKMTIAQGSDGDPSGGSTGAGYGAWGGTFSPPKNCGDGDALWMGAWMYFDSGFSWQSYDASKNPGYIKFFRFSNTGNGQKLDLYALNKTYLQQSGPEQIGWTLVSEITPQVQPNTNKQTQTIVTLGSWHWVETYQKFSATTNTDIVLWVDEVFVYSRIGPVNTWIDQNGIQQTETLSSGIQSLGSSSDVNDSAYIFTYWNGYSPIDNTAYLQKVALHTSLDSGSPTKTDQFGNLMMGRQ